MAVSPSPSPAPPADDGVTRSAEADSALLFDPFAEDVPPAELERRQQEEQQRRRDEQQQQRDQQRQEQQQQREEQQREQQQQKEAPAPTPGGEYAPPDNDDGGSGNPRKGQGRQQGQGLPEPGSWVPTWTAADLQDPGWRGAPACAGEPGAGVSAVRDSVGRLWGWQGGASCAFKDGDRPVTNADPLVGTTWEAAPRCDFPRIAANSVQDTWGRWWGWQDGVSCKFLTRRQAAAAAAAAAAADNAEDDGAAGGGGGNGGGNGGSGGQETLLGWLGF